MVRSQKYHPLLISEERFRAECRIEFSRRSGPGGQHRNKVETAVRVTHLPTGIVGEASERRSQAENRSVALKRLRLNLALQIRSREWNGENSNLLNSHAVWDRYRKGTQLRISEENPDFPIAIMEFLDVWDETGHDEKRSAEMLSTTVSQLNRLIGKTPVLQRVTHKTERNLTRNERGEKILIGLGANLGDREKNLLLAWERLGKREELRPIALSRLIETAPVGGPPNQPKFLNAVGLLETTLAPLDLLDVLNFTEKEGGRERHEFWGARTVDLDLLLYGNLIIRSERLTIPHPRMIWRPFVLIPAREIAPDFCHPIFDRTIAELAVLAEMNLHANGQFLFVPQGKEGAIDEFWRGGDLTRPTSHSDGGDLQ